MFGAGVIGNGNGNGNHILDEGEAGAIYAPRRPEGHGTKASQARATRRACYGQPFSGLPERAQKMAAVASHWQK